MKAAVIGEVPLHITDQQVLIEGHEITSFEMQCSWIILFIRTSLILTTRLYIIINNKTRPVRVFSSQTHHVSTHFSTHSVCVCLGGQLNSVTVEIF